MTPRALALVSLLALPAAVPAGVRPAHGGTIRIALPSPPLSAAGEERAGDLFVQRALSAPLLELDARGELVPGALAEVPRPEAGGRAFRLRLRPGLREAGGRPIGAGDVAARLGALLRSPAPHAWVALPILGADAVLDGRAALLAGVQVLSPGELLVTLAFPLPEFPWLLATTPAALPGAGPFVSAGRRSAGEPLVLLRNDHHHDGRPFADAIELTAPDGRSAARLLERGEVDAVLRPDATGGIPAAALPPLGVTVAALNPARLGPGSRTVRGTLAALDRAELARRFVRGPAEPLFSLVPPAVLPGASPVGPGDDLRDPPDVAPPTLALLADSSEPDSRALAARIQVKLFDAGVRATVDAVEPGRFRERIAAGDFDVALVSVPVIAFRPALAVAQIVHATRGASAARRALAAMSGLDAGEALETSARIARELDLVPLVASAARATLGPALQGFAPAADGSLDLGDLWLLGGGTR